MTNVILTEEQKHQLKNGVAIVLDSENVFEFKKDTVEEQLNKKGLSKYPTE